MIGLGSDKKRRKELEKEGIDSAHGHHCTLYKALWHPESTIYILAMVLINSGYSIIDEKSMTWVERENYFLSFIFKTLDSQTFSQGAASLRSVTVFIGKWRKLRPIKKAIGKSRKLTKM